MSSKAGMVALALAAAAMLASGWVDAQRGGGGGGGGGARTPPSGGPGTGNPGRPGGPVYGGGGGGWHGGGGGSGWHGGGRWHGGGSGWHGGYYRSWGPSVGIYYGWPYAWGWGPSWYWGSPWYGWGWGYPYTYSAYASPGVVGYVGDPVEYVERAPVSESGMWYYCEDPPGYYPHVARCNRPWMQVRPADVQGTAPAPRQ